MEAVVWKLWLSAYFVTSKWYMNKNRFKFPKHKRNEFLNLSVNWVSLRKEVLINIIRELWLYASTDVHLRMILFFNREKYHLRFKLIEPRPFRGEATCTQKIKRNKHTNIHEKVVNIKFIRYWWRIWEQDDGGLTQNG